MTSETFFALVSSGATDALQVADDYLLTLSDILELAAMQECGVQRICQWLTNRKLFTPVWTHHTLAVLSDARIRSYERAGV